MITIGAIDKDQQPPSYMKLDADISKDCTYVARLPVDVISGLSEIRARTVAARLATT